MSGPDGPEEREAERLDRDTYDHDVEAARSEDFDGWAQAALDRLPNMNEAEQIALSNSLIKLVKHGDKNGFGEVLP